MRKQLDRFNGKVRVTYITTSIAPHIADGKYYMHIDLSKDKGNNIINLLVLFVFTIII